jgi:hypothetical protein
MDAQLSLIVTPTMLAASPEEWKVVWRAVKPKLSPEEQKRAKLLRRRSLSCLYARRSRQKRATAMNALVDSNTVLATENLWLRVPRLQTDEAVVVAGAAAVATMTATATNTTGCPTYNGSEGADNSWTLAVAAAAVASQQQQYQHQMARLPVEHVC